MLCLGALLSGMINAVDGYIQISQLESPCLLGLLGLQRDSVRARRRCGMDHPPRCIIVERRWSDWEGLGVKGVVCCGVGLLYNGYLVS